MALDLIVLVVVNAEAVFHFGLISIDLVFLVLIDVHLVLHGGGIDGAANVSLLGYLRGLGSPVLEDG